MNENGIHDIGDIAEPVASEGPPWGMIGAGIATILLLIFTFQNFESVHVEFLWLEVNLPVAVLIGITALVTLAITLTIGALARRRKRKRATQAAKEQ